MLDETINQAVKILKSGGLVGLPTETVYGLAADATNAQALRKIFYAKQRPIDHPLIVHLANISQLSVWTSDVSAMALQLAHAYWPGPMTLILPKANGVSDLITGGQETVGIRIPRHPVAHALLTQFGHGVAAPSANRFGRISPTTADAVREELGDAVDIILDGGQSTVGIESTIIDVSCKTPVILRPGMISVADIEAVLQCPVAAKKDDAPRVSGSLASHYAPITPTSLIQRDHFQKLTEIRRSSVLLVREPVLIHHPFIEVVMMPNHPNAFAHDIYQTLRDLDKRHFEQIFIEAVPTSVEWDAVRDRLKRACGG